MKVATGLGEGVATLEAPDMPELFTVDGDVQPEFRQRVAEHRVTENRDKIFNAFIDQLDRKNETIRDQRRQIEQLQRRLRDNRGLSDD